MLDEKHLKDEFADNEGYVWKLKLNVGLIEDIKEDLQIDFDEMMKEPKNFVTILFTEPKKLVSLLYFICRKQVEAVPLTPREFGHRFDREVLDKAADALLAAVLLFYPRTSAGKVLMDNLPRVLEKMDSEITEKVTKSVTSLLSGSPTD